MSQREKWDGSACGLAENRDRGHSVAGAECHLPVHMLDGMELGSNGEFQVLCELRERQGPGEKAPWHKERCCPVASELLFTLMFLT